MKHLWLCDLWWQKIQNPSGNPCLKCWIGNMWQMNAISRHNKLNISISLYTNANINLNEQTKKQKETYMSFTQIKNPSTQTSKYNFKEAH